MSRLFPRGRLQVRYASMNRHLPRQRVGLVGAKSGREQMQQTCVQMPGLFDHLVGARQERLRDRQAERLCGGQIEDEIELGRLLDRNVARLCSMQNLVDKVGSAPKQVREVCSIGHQTPPLRRTPESRAWSQSHAQRQGVDSNLVGIQKRVGADIVHLRGLERLEYRRDILGSPDFRCDHIEAKRADRCMSLAQFQHGVGVADIGQDRQRAKTGENLAQYFDALTASVMSCTRRRPRWPRANKYLLSGLTRC
jgi:hypothetical protein